MTDYTKEGADFDRIYSSCLQLPEMRLMVKFLQETQSTPQSYDYGPVDDLLAHNLHFEILYRFKQQADQLCRKYTALLGPRITLLGPPDGELGRGIILAFNWDSKHKDKGIKSINNGLTLNDDHYDSWYETAFAKAASVYCRECGWDFAPGQAGIWLVYCILTDCGGTNSYFQYHGNLLSFALLYDRDKDGKYESVGHLWTAQEARRKGIAQQVLAQARKRFPIRTIETPWTDSGRALIEAVWPEKAEELDQQRHRRTVKRTRRKAGRRDQNGRRQ